MMSMDISLILAGLCVVVSFFFCGRAVLRFVGKVFHLIFLAIACVFAYKAGYKFMDSIMNRREKR